MKKCCQGSSNPIRLIGKVRSNFHSELNFSVADQRYRNCLWAELCSFKITMLISLPWFTECDSIWAFKEVIR